MRVAAIIPAAGFGTRMKTGLSKQFLPLGGKAVLSHTLAVFDGSSIIDEIVLVISKEDRKIAEEKVLGSSLFKKISAVVEGGIDRRESVSKGLQAVDAKCDFVVIHDGCRPFVSQEMIETSLEAAKKTGAAIAGIPLQDTLKRADQGFVGTTIDRTGLWQAQTPQTFRYHLLFNAYENAFKKQIGATDDASIVEQYGCQVKIFPGSVLNMKITVPEDLILAEFILQHQNKNNPNDETAPDDPLSADRK